MRLVALFVLAAAPAFCWVESVEFRWNAFPKPLWERELVWLKNIGVKHVSLPLPADPEQITDLLRLLKSLRMEADFEGAFPAALEHFTVAHGGPLVTQLPQPAARISVLLPNALMESRKQLLAGKASIVWTEVEDTLAGATYRSGAVNFAGDEKTATVAIRRNAQLLGFWAASFASLKAHPGAAAKPLGLSIGQYVGTAGVSAVAIGNVTEKPYDGEIRVWYPPAKQYLSIPKITVPARSSLWLPVNIPIGGGNVCKSCTAFAVSDNLVYATAELTGLEYENGILAMEFSAPAPAEVVLQLTRQPSGPYVAGGRPHEFDWDPHTQRVRLAIPAGKGAGERVRVGLAMEPPEATAFFDSARVLVIGEKNRLTAQFSSEEIAKRSRLVMPAGFTVEQQTKSPLEITYDILVPEGQVHGDHAELSIEADGAQLSHSRVQLLRAASLRFPDAVGVKLGPSSVLPLFPSVVSVNARSGRDIVIGIRNNAPEIRTFELKLAADRLEFSPASIQITVGASAVREVKIRVFPGEGSPGVHEGTAVLSGAAYWKEPIRFVLVPNTGAAAWSSGDFQFVESAKLRATFLGDRWLEYLDKDKNENRLLAPMNFPASESRSLDELEKKVK